MAFLLWRRLVWILGDILEDDSASNLLACENSLVTPVNEDADVARPVGWHGGG